MRIITAISSIVLIATSVWCFLHIGATFISLAFLLGVAMVIQAFSEICSFIGALNGLEKTSWIITEAVSTGILGICVLANMLTVDAVIPIFFGMWIMYSGLLRTVAATRMTIAKEKGWTSTLVLGIMAIGVGVYSFFNSALLAYDNITLVAVIFLLQGANIMALAVNMPGKYKIIPLDYDPTEEPEGEKDFVFTDYDPYEAESVQEDGNQESEKSDDE